MLASLLDLIVGFATGLVFGIIIGHWLSLRDVEKILGKEMEEELKESGEE